MITAQPISQDAATTDRLACALYAQAVVMEAMGHNFDVELAEARALGMTGADGKSGA